VKTGKASLLHKPSRPGIEKLPPLVSYITEITSFDGMKIPLNVYYPKPKDAGAKPPRMPVLVKMHGGPFMSDWLTYTYVGRFYTAVGYAVVEVNFRGSSGFGRAFEEADNREKRDDQFKDIELTAKWIADQPWADPDRLVIFGPSYGGYLTLIGLTRQPHIWAAGVDIIGPSNLTSLLTTTQGKLRSLLISEFGDVEKDGPLLERFSPLKDVDKIRAPLFVYQGENDPRVPRSEADQIVRAVRQRGLPVEYMIAKNEGHSADRNESMMELQVRSARFLETHLGRPEEPAKHKRPPLTTAP
jgi:dipeptidyl aminopeptidase/acylaminoacyl peptidase